MESEMSHYKPEEIVSARFDGHPDMHIARGVRNGHPLEVRSEASRDDARYAYEIRVYEMDIADALAAGDEARAEETPCLAGLDVPADA